MLTELTDTEEYCPLDNWTEEGYPALLALVKAMVTTTNMSAEMMYDIIHDFTHCFQELCDDDDMNSTKGALLNFTGYAREEGVAVALWNMCHSLAAWRNKRLAGVEKETGYEH